MSTIGENIIIHLKDKRNTYLYYNIKKKGLKREH